MQLKAKPFFIAALAISLYVFLLVSQKIILATADLGRHLKNGQLFFQHHIIPATNTYSYTFSNFPVINHHWGSGAVFYLVYKLAGFTGLSFFYVGLIALAAFFSLRLAAQNSPKNISIPIIAGLLAVPLITYRIEVRPEGLSFLFVMLDLYLLTAFFNRRISFLKLAAGFLAIQLFWVNLHLFFVFGLALSGLALISSLLTFKLHKTTKQLTILALAAAIISLVNPFFVKGLLEPFMIFKNYGYMIVENQTILFALRRIPSYVFIHTLALAGIIVVSLLTYILIKIRSKSSQLLTFKPQDIFLTLALLFFTLLAMRYIRAIPLMGLVFIPWFSLCLYALRSKFKINPAYFQLTAAIFVFFIIWFGLAFPSAYSPWRYHRFGWGLAPQSQAAGRFFTANNLKGPIFNNYDIGGYLIWYLYPKQKVFVDNRPEAYPASFFQKTYIPAQQDDRLWQKLDQKYNFNAIFFYRRDATPWAQPFLIKRLKDPDWAPIYVDPYVLILIKNTSQNQKLIDKYRLPADLFNTQK
ncbi:MAG: hypothetical protein GXP43_00640 [bacterium]|nr:hypothetical protein [bacterium]